MPPTKKGGERDDDDDEHGNETGEGVKKEVAYRKKR